MPTTSIKIDTAIKEQLEKDAKKNFRSVAGQASYYIQLGMDIEKGELNLRVQDRMEETNDKSK